MGRYVRADPDSDSDAAEPKAIKQKNDQFCVGQMADVAGNPVQGPSCPVRVIKEWVRLRSEDTRADNVAC